MLGIVIDEGLDEGAESRFLSIFEIGGVRPDAGVEGLEVGEGLGAGGGEVRKEIVEGEGEVVGGGIGEKTGNGWGRFFGDTAEAGEGLNFDGEQVMKNVGEGPRIGRNARQPHTGVKATEGTCEVAGGSVESLEKFCAAGHHKIIRIL